MKIHTLILGLVTCFVLVGNGVVLSQESESLPQERSHGKFSKIDKDGDNLVSEDEFLAVAAMRFERLDSDDDGFITADEFKAGKKAVREKRRERRERRQGETEIE